MAADSSSYNLILDHVLSYPASYEMPLRTMYTLNCAPRAQPLPHHLATLQPLPEESSSGSSTDSAGCIGNSLGQSATTAKQATAHFTSSLMEHIAHLPSQPCSLPPSFINTFARRCFPADLAAVDFPHALTSLDYIKDLEMRRRRDFAAALHRLGLDRTTLQSADADRFAHSFPAVAAWLRSMDDRERKVDALYTQLYVAVRRWVSADACLAPAVHQPFSQTD